MAMVAIRVVIGTPLRPGASAPTTVPAVRGGAPRSGTTPPLVLIFMAALVTIPLRLANLALTAIIAGRDVLQGVTLLPVSTMASRATRTGDTRTGSTR